MLELWNRIVRLIHITHCTLYSKTGTRLLIVDDQNIITRSCSPDPSSEGCDENDELFHETVNTEVADAAWFKGLPLWTDRLNGGIGFFDGRRGLSSIVANLYHFSEPTGIYVYHGKEYLYRSRQSNAFKGDISIKARLYQICVFVSIYLVRACVILCLGACLAINVLK